MLTSRVPYQVKVTHLDTERSDTVKIPAVRTYYTAAVNTLWFWDNYSLREQITYIPVCIVTRPRAGIMSPLRTAVRMYTTLVYCWSSSRTHSNRTRCQQRKSDATFCNWPARSYIRRTRLQDINNPVWRRVRILPP
jgi:hypothetical protein